MTRTWTQEEMDRAESLYVALATSQFQARLDAILQRKPFREGDKVYARQLRDASAALGAARDDARAIFFDTITGKLP